MDQHVRGEERNGDPNEDAPQRRAVEPMQEPAEREVLGHDQRERADRDSERDGNLQGAAAVVLRDRRCR